MPTRAAWMIVGALVLLPVAGARGDSVVLAPYHADYSLARNSLTLGTAKFSLQPDSDGGYIYKSVSHATGLAALFAGDVITQISRFEMAGGQLRPLAYSYSQSGGRDTESEYIQFDWSKQLAQGEEDGRKHRTPLVPGISDVFLIQLVLAVDAADDCLAKQYTLLDHGETTAYEPRRLPDQKMEVDSTQVDAMVLELKDPKKGRTISVWLAPALHYLPVQIRQSQPGKATFTLTLDDVSFENPAPSASTSR